MLAAKDANMQVLHCVQLPTHQLKHKYKERKDDEDYTQQGTDTTDGKAGKEEQEASRTKNHAISRKLTQPTSYLATALFADTLSGGT